VLVNWCPALGTVLANEEVINGLSERGDHPVERIPLRQWVLKVIDLIDISADGWMCMHHKHGYDKTDPVHDLISSSQ